MKKINETDLELVDSYIKKEMSEDEKMMFEERLKTDIKMKNILLASLAINSALTKEKLKKQINHLAAQHIIYKRKKKIVYSFSLSSILLVAMFLSLYFVYQNKDNSQQLYAEYHKVYEPQTQVRGVELNDKLQIAKVLYESKQYSQSLEMLQELISQGNENDEVNFFKGLNLLELDVNQSDIVASLSKVSKSKSSYKYSAMWFLALNYIKINQSEKAKPLLMSLSQSNNFYSKSAKEIIEQL
ncbi:MAG: hypothetical protein A2033_15285 [Bacteroidetes bacterium GWA2_31_9]|nr:MAG: hypothetical protein A2033_15285 [Bacteroidetes bacterium GWA2_31_9]